MAKLTLDDVTNNQDDQSFVSTINSNSSAIETAMENTLSRDGTTPNDMNANLDMDSNRILNLPEPINASEPARKAELDALVLGEISIGGTGIVVKKTDDTLIGRTLVEGTDITITNPAGDAGDITISYSGTPTVADDAITFAKMQNIATNSLIGRDTASTGDPENILLNATLSMDGSGNLQRAALTGDVTASAGSNATTIANDAVTYAKMQNVSAGDRVLGRLSSSGDVTELTGAQVGGLIALDDLSTVNAPTPTDTHVLTYNSGTGQWISAASSAGAGAPVGSAYITATTDATLSDERVATDTATVAWDFGTGGQAKANVPDAGITLAKMANIATDSLIGRDTAGSGVPENITLSTGLEMNGSGALRIASAYQAIGKQCIPIPAAAMYPLAIAPAASGSITLGNGFDIKTWDFDSTGSEGVQFTIPMPDAWDEGTVTFRAIWAHPATTTNFGTAWTLAGMACSNDDALNVTISNSVTIVDTGGTTDDCYITDESGAHTINGSPAAGDLVHFEFLRQPANGSDTLAVDAKLIGLKLYITTASGHE